MPTRAPTTPERRPAPNPTWFQLATRAPNMQSTTPPTTADTPEIDRSSGQRLPGPLEERAVASFGEPVRRVRVHTDGPANRAAERVQARAFTVDSDIYFGEGAYQPSGGGLELIGHELTHVLQQRAGLEPASVRGPGDRYEREADAAARSFATGHRVGLSPTTRRGASPASTNTARGAAQAKPIQREVDGTLKIKGEVKVFTPTIGDSVGAGGTNEKADVKTVQTLLKDQGYAVEVTGTADAATLAAIVEFQKKTFPKWSSHDGLIEVGKKTWGALSDAYYNPDPIARERKQFAKRRNVMISPTDITSAVSSTLAYVEDSDSDKLDDVIGWSQQAADKNPSVDNIKAKGVRHVAAILQTYYDAGISVGTLYVTSHGSYRRSAFMFGDEMITAANVSRLGILRNLLAPGTKLVVMACHVGGGSKPADARKFTAKLAQTLGITVYTSRSWSLGSKKLYTKGKPASYFGDPSTYDASDVSKRPNVYRFLGQWLEATPGKDKATVTQVNAPIFRDDGGFDVGEERFPTFSDDDEAAYQGVVSGIK